MTPPPLVCPSPEPEPDCPLFDQRALSEVERLRRAVLAERHGHPGLAALIRAEAGAASPRLPRALLPPAPAPPTWPLPLIPHPETKGTR